MPRIQMTPMARFGLIFLMVYLAAMLVLIAVKFIQALRGA
jgi:hypothetical protein